MHSQKRARSARSTQVERELGHLLLGNLDHSSTGLMKARLGHKDLQSAAKRDLAFTEMEAVLIRRAILGE